jgi:uncharacterized protein YciI
MTTAISKIFKFIATCFLFTLTLSANAQSDNSNYDKRLADSLHADEYGMKRYVLAILKTGSASINDKSVVDSLFQGHMQNISVLVDSGKLVVAGPLQRNEKTYRGIFILNVESIEEASALLQTDPAIKAKLLETELFSWYGSAALPMYLKFHEKLGRKKY